MSRLTPEEFIAGQQAALLQAIGSLQHELNELTLMTKPATWRDVAKHAKAADVAQYVIDSFEDDQ